MARDRLAMTPFNSTVVRFRARYPMTYAVKAIDWETKYGLGMEYQAFNIGDGGFIAYFSDGNGTHADCCGSRSAGLTLASSCGTYSPATRS